MRKDSKLRGIFFDFDGTLANSMHMMYRAYELFLNEFQIPPSKNGFALLNGPPLSKIVQSIQKSYNLPFSVEYLLERYNYIIDELFMSVPPNDGANDLIDAALNHSLKLALVTSNSKVRVSTWLEKNGFENKFNCIISNEDVLIGKPHPEPYLLALEKTNLADYQVIAVEDSEQGALSACKAKIKTYLMLNGSTLNNSFNENIIFVNSLTDLNKILFRPG